jgi:hypothetical protein
VSLPTADRLYAEAKALPGGEPDSIFGDTVDREWRLLREYKPEPDSEGGLARVYVMRLPAQFWRLTAGDVEITTGSGSDMGVLMCALGKAISEGMATFSVGVETS